MELHFGINQKQIVGILMGQNAPAHTNDWLGSGCCQQLTQQVFEGRTSNGFKGVLPALALTY